MWLLSTLILYFSIISNVKSTLDYLQHPVKSCHIGDSIENECTKCVCTSKTVFECTPLDCNNKTTSDELEASGPLCSPNQLYVQNLITCICTKDGRWPHKSCHDTFKSLAPRNVTTFKCEPDTYIPIDCNVCRCGPGGKIINDRCTRNACENDIQRRASSPNTLFSKCEEKCWYSLAPCQFCFCLKQNKLVCNTGSYYTNHLDLGTYKLNICGKDLIREAIELIPDTGSDGMLRATSEAPSTTTTIAAVPTLKIVTESISDEASDDVSSNLAIELGENAMLINARAQPNATNSNEYYSDDTEEQVKIVQTSKPTLPPPTTTVRAIKHPVTVNIPYIESEEEGDKIRAKSKKTDANFEDLEVEITKDPEEDGIARAVPDNVQDQSSDTKTGTYHYDGKTLKISIPTVLKDAFQKSMRKAMTSLSNKTKCTVPGAKTMKACNTCYCLKNGKLLCTNHKCDGDRKA